MPATLFHKVAESFAGSLYVGRSEANLLYLQQVALRTTTPAQLVDSMVQVLDDMRYLSGTTVAAPSHVVRFMGQIGIVTPFFEAVPLRLLQTEARAKKIPFPVRVATKIALDVFDGLCQYHALDAKLYGGICPDHLLVGTDGDTRLGNVPVSAIAPKESPWRGKVERLAYLAPEQVTTAQGFDARTDVYAIGLILWEMITNQPRLSGTPIQILEALRAQRGQPDLAPLERTQVSKGLYDALTRALNPSPAERQASVGSFALDLLEAEEEPAAPGEVAEFVERVAKDTLQTLRTAVAVQQIEAIKESRAPKLSDAPKATTQMVEAEQLLAAIRESKPTSVPPPADRTEVFNVSAELLERARRLGTARTEAKIAPRERKPTPAVIDMTLGNDKTVTFEVPDDLLDEARRLFQATEKAAEVADLDIESPPLGGRKAAVSSRHTEPSAKYKPDEPTTDQKRAEELLKKLRGDAVAAAERPEPPKVEDDVTTIWRPERQALDVNTGKIVPRESETTGRGREHGHASPAADTHSQRVGNPGLVRTSLPPNRVGYWLLGLVVSVVVGAITVFASRFLGH